LLTAKRILGWQVDDRDGLCAGIDYHPYVWWLLARLARFWWQKPQATSLNRKCATGTCASSTAKNCLSWHVDDLDGLCAGIDYSLCVVAAGPLLWWQKPQAFSFTESVLQKFVLCQLQGVWAGRWMTLVVVVQA